METILKANIINKETPLIMRMEMQENTSRFVTNLDLICRRSGVSYLDQSHSEI